MQEHSNIDRIQAIRALELEHFADAYFDNVRFRNCIRRAAAEGRLPFTTIGQYIDGGIEAKWTLLKIPNLGIHSLEEFDKALQLVLISGMPETEPSVSIQSEPETPIANEQKPYGKRLDLVEQVRAQYPLAFDNLLAQYRDAPEEDAELCLSIELALQSVVTDQRAAEIAYRRFMGETLESIGDELGITRERVRQLESKFKLLVTEINTEAFIRKAIDALMQALESKKFPGNEDLEQYHPLLPSAIRRVFLADRTIQGNGPLSPKERRVAAVRLGISEESAEPEHGANPEPGLIDPQDVVAENEGPVADFPAGQGNLALQQWLVDMLQSRGIDAPDSRMLYGYNLSVADYSSLEAALTIACQCAGFSVLTARNRAFPPLFVLFAAEWWKREYAGGAWDWDPILLRLGAGNHDVNPAVRSECVTRGLIYWGHHPYTEGKRFLGAIVAQGGIPMRMLAQGVGALPTILTQVIKLADRYGWGRPQVIDALQEQTRHLPNAYRRSEIIGLLVDFAETVIALKHTFQLANVADPIIYLDQQAPDWKRRFPISLENDAAQALLVGLVREAAAQKAPASTSLFRCDRRLVEYGRLGVFALESVIDAAVRANADDFAKLFGINDGEALPRYFCVDLDGEQRREFLDGRPIHGAEQPAVRLNGARLLQRGPAAASEHALVLRNESSDRGLPLTVGGEMPVVDPWVFVEREGEMTRYVGAGSLKLPDAGALVVLAPGWRLMAEGSVTELGILADIEPARTVMRVEGNCSIVSDDLTYRLRLSQTSDQPMLFQWSGVRLPDASGKLVFKGSERLRLYKSAEDGLVPVAGAEQIWRRPVTGEVLTPREARGPVEVRVVEDGETVTRQRIFVLPAEARITYQSDPVNLGSAKVRFENWGQVDVAVEPLTGMASQVLQQSGVTELQLNVTGDPPGLFRAKVHWPGCPVELPLDLPFPSTGGRFIRANGEPFTSRQRVGIDDLLGARLRLFDTNPMAPKSYVLQLALVSGRREERVQYPIRLDASGRGEIRLIDYQRSIVSLLGMTDHLDNVVAVRLLVGEKPVEEIQVARYVAVLQREDEHVGLLDAELACMPVERIRDAFIIARPLVQTGAEPQYLAGTETEGVPTGRWLASGLHASGNPWLIYPGNESAIQCRPMIWIAKSTVESDTAPDANESQGAGCPLTHAMVLLDAEERRNALHDAIKLMGRDPGHPSWDLVIDQWTAFRHLPLPALDLWRVLGKQQRAVVALLLHGGLPHEDVPVLARRLRDEIGWWPELTSLEEWHETVKGLWTSWVRQLPSEVAKPIFLDHIQRRFETLRGEFPALELVLDLVVFEMTSIASEALGAIWSVADISSDVLVRSLWQGQESIGNTQLFLVNAGRDNWPERDLFDKAFTSFATVLDKTDKARAKLLTKWAGKLFWMNPDDFKFTMANMPMLCALWALTSVGRAYWREASHRVALKRVRDFDPVWFEQGYRHAIAALLTIDGLVEPVCFIDLPD